MVSVEYSKIPWNPNLVFQRENALAINIFLSAEGLGGNSTNTLPGNDKT
jgi:hypothetical protein